MLAVLLENDTHSRNVLSHMLNALGFSRVRAASHLEECVYILEEEKGRIDLIISSHDAQRGLDFPLSRLILKTSSLDTCPLVALAENWRSSGISFAESRLTRVDDVLLRPFNQKALELSIGRAFERRSRLRSTLVFYGNTSTARKLEEEMFSNDETQWKSLIHLETPEELTQFLKRADFRLGGILLEPDERLKDVAPAIKRFKQSRLGLAVPLGSYGQDPALLSPFLSFIEISFPETGEWHWVLKLLSRRSSQGWKMRHRIRKIRESIKGKNSGQAKSLLKEAIKWDEERWELLEIKGVINGEAAAIRKALETQPGSPYAYLSLLDLVSAEERAQVISQSKLYCPQHPELILRRQ